MKHITDLLSFMLILKICKQENCSLERNAKNNNSRNYREHG